MQAPGTSSNPLRVAVIGSGPTGFFTAEHLFKAPDLHVQVDMFDRLPTPYGLVRGGVAPDHQKIKKVTVGYDKTAARDEFRFYGNVEIGRHLSLAELREHYHQIVFCTGAQTDRRMEIPGEDLEGSRTATEFVAWYNGHPDYRDCRFDLSVERVVVVGVGNVAVDVARILCRTPEELAATDIADYALEALKKSQVKEVVMLGRRGPAQAAFTNPEAKELGELEGADLFISPEDAIPDALSQEDLAANPDRATEKKLAMLKEFSEQPARGLPRRLTLRFLVSPVELVDDGQGRVGGVKLVTNELYRDHRGNLRPRATEKFEVLPAGLVLRSVGYRGVALPDVPFHDAWGVIPNQEGRILNGEAVCPGEYVAGWIKRGPSGVIGTNKPCAKETVERMLEDVAAGQVHQPGNPSREALEARLQGRTRWVSFADWKRLDDLEVSRGQSSGRPRVKFTSVDEMLEALQIHA
ncbi:MAG: FAD-dependent oxidoreductase [Vulcanimicrobiota bacterium]